VSNIQENKIQIDESKLIKTIVIASDWEEVITNIIEEEGIDPSNINIVKLVDAFLDYLKTLKKFDFRIPARFILIASILLRMKCEVLKINEQKEETLKPNIDINVPLVDLPIIRTPKRKVTLTELINALQKVIEFEEKKKLKKLRLRRNVENLIGEYEDIEIRIEKIYERIKNEKIKNFSSLVGEWNRKNIVYNFIPLLHLVMNNKIICYQQEIFGEIFIELKEVFEKQTNQTN